MSTLHRKIAVGLSVCALIAVPIAFQNCGPGFSLHEIEGFGDDNAALIFASTTDLSSYCVNQTPGFDYDEEGVCRVACHMYDYYGFAELSKVFTGGSCPSGYQPASFRSLEETSDSSGDTVCCVGSKNACEKSGVGSHLVDSGLYAVVGDKCLPSCSQAARLAVRQDSSLSDGQIHTGDACDSMAPEEEHGVQILQRLDSYESASCCISEPISQGTDGGSGQTACQKEGKSEANGAYKTVGNRCLPSCGHAANLAKRADPSLADAKVFSGPECITARGDSYFIYNIRFLTAYEGLNCCLGEYLPFTQGSCNSFNGHSNASCSTGRVWYCSHRHACSAHLDLL